MNDTLISLRDLDRISAYLVYVSLFFWALSAYKRTKQKGFVFLGFAAIGFVLTAPMPFHSGGSTRHGSHSALYSDAVHGLGIVSNILMLTGLILIIQDYIALFTARGATQANPPASAEE